jgi:hypothetical protein
MEEDELGREEGVVRSEWGGRMGQRWRGENIDSMIF